MTFSEGNGKRWDYNIQRYKNNRDVFLEPGLVSVVFLACGRPEITRRCLLSTLEAATLYNEEIEWIFIENGHSQENLSFFDSLPMQRKVILKQNNYGINQGLNQGLALSRGEFVMIHENDWECRFMDDFFGHAKDIMHSNGDIGVIQLRAINDPSENWGYGKPEYSPWSCTKDALDKAGIKVWEEKTECASSYYVSIFPNAFNNNPIIMRKTLYRECGPYPEPEFGTDPRHGETEYQERVAKTGCAAAHIGMEIYYHCGQKTTPTI